MARRPLLTPILAGAVLACGLPSAAAAPRALAVEPGKEFVLRKGQRADLKGIDASIRIAGFVNSPCPKGARCVWSGQAVYLELTVAGATVPLNASAPVSVEILSSDYTTLARLRASVKSGGR